MSFDFDMNSMSPVESGGGGGGSAPTITCTNATGSDIASGDKVFIAANSNYTLINWNVSSAGCFTGIAKENIAAGASGSVSALITEPSSPLALWSRVDNKATVAGFWTDENNITYAICVADAAYRGAGVRWTSTTAGLSSLPSYSSAAAALATGKSATWTIETLKTATSLTGAFLECYNNTLEYEGVIYHGALPNLAELQSIIYSNRDSIDVLDPTLESYPDYSLATWGFGGYVWSANVRSGNENRFTVLTNGTSGMRAYSSTSGYIPIFEIPVSTQSAPGR